MSKSKHSEAQIIAALKQVEAGRAVEDLAREYGVSKHTIYAWKSKYGGRDVSEAQEVKPLREEKARRKKLVADLSLDKDMRPSVIRKLPGLVEKRAEVRRLVDEFRGGERGVCGLMEIPRMSYRYRSRRDDSALRQRLLKLAREKPRLGYRRLWVMLTSVERVNHKRVWRVYRDLGLSVKRTRRKRLQRALRPRPVRTAPNQEWAGDFVSDVAASGRRLRIFPVVDSYTRECLALEVDTSLPSRRGTRALAELMDRRGAPVAIRSDHGPELSSRHFLAWCIEKRIDAGHLQPGKPTQNAHLESFNGRLRDECLNVSWFWNLFAARAKIAAWRENYNSRRPHSALRYLTPEEFARRAASPSLPSNITRPALPQGFPDGSGLDPDPAA